MPKVRVRDAISGEFTTEREAKRRPATTVTERVKRKTKKKKTTKR